MSEWEMEDPVGPEKLVELKYKVIDAKTKGILTSVVFQLAMCTASTRFWPPSH